MLQLGFGQWGKLLSALQAPYLNVYPDYCSRLRHKNSKCTRCSDNCPTGAIEWNGGNLATDPDKCSSCGICAGVCPNGVFEALEPSDLEILKKVEGLVQKQPEIVFKCNPKGESARGSAITVPSLGRLNEGVLVGCIAAGAGTVQLLHGACQGCKHEACRSLVAETVVNANALLEHYGMPARVSLEEKDAKPAEEVLSSRREFFTTLVQEAKKGGTSVARSVLGSFDEKPTRRFESLPVKLPVKRQLLLYSLNKLGNPLGQTFESPLFCQFEVNENCNGCQMCALFCPTGAIGKVDEDGKAGINFKVSDCTACNLCREICYRNAVNLSNRVELDRVTGRTVTTVMMREGGLPTAEEKWKSLF